VLRKDEPMALFVASDGTVFTDQVECAEYDAARKD
jgi:hypothetical protein